MGNTALQHRISTGCFASKLSSSGWSPGSRGKARCNKAFKSEKSSPSLCSLLIRLLVIAIPFLVLIDSNLNPTLNLPSMASVKKYEHLAISIRHQESYGAEQHVRKKETAIREQRDQVKARISPTKMKKGVVKDFNQLVKVMVVLVVPMV